MPAVAAGDEYSVRGSTHWFLEIEPWYLSYGLLGMVMAGLVPMLVPLVVSGSGSAGQVGLVMGALSLGGLPAPLWGILADRFRWHRWLLTGGIVAIIVGSGLFEFSPALGLWLGLALLLGLGASAAGTVASLFVESTKNQGVTQTYYVESHAGMKYAIAKRQPTGSSTLRKRESTFRSLISLPSAFTSVALPYPRGFRALRTERRGDLT